MHPASHLLRQRAAISAAVIHRLGSLLAVLTDPLSTAELTLARLDGASADDPDSVVVTLHGYVHDFHLHHLAAFTSGHVVGMLVVV